MDKSTLYLVVYHDKVNPAHWQLLLADQRSSETAIGGTTIEVVSSYYGGFEHKISHGYNEADSESRHSKILLGLIDSSLISNVDVEQCALSTDANGLDCHLKVEELQEYNCQTWTKVFVKRLVNHGYLSSEAISLVQNAPVH